MTHEDYMRQAIELARACIPDGDVPVGCVIADGPRRDRSHPDGLRRPGQLAAGGV